MRSNCTYIKKEKMETATVLCPRRLRYDNAQVCCCRPAAERPFLLSPGRFFFRGAENLAADRGNRSTWIMPQAGSTPFLTRAEKLNSTSALTLTISRPAFCCTPCTMQLGMNSTAAVSKALPPRCRIFHAASAAVSGTPAARRTRCGWTACGLPVHCGVCPPL